MTNGRDQGFKPGPANEEGEVLDAETYEGYVSTAKAQRHARAVAELAGQNGYPHEPPEAAPDQAPPAQPDQAPPAQPDQAPPPRIDPNDPRMRRTALTPPPRQLQDTELAEWSRGAVLGIALGCVLGVGIAYLLVSRIEKEVSEDGK